MRSSVNLALACALVAACGAACNGAPGAASDKSPSAPPTVVKPKPAGNAQPTLPRGTVVLEAAPRPAVTISVEVATTPRQQQMGLMFRETLPANEGMIFLFAVPRENSFWMRDTLIPLDLLFIDSNWTVVGVVENAKPMTDDPREVATPSQSVLEVNAGFVKKHGLGVGTKVKFTPPEAL
jgi:uncharacterized membrane protein (UPF0127 family)